MLERLSTKAVLPSVIFAQRLTVGRLRDSRSLGFFSHDPWAFSRCCPCLLGLFAVLSWNMCWRSRDIGGRSASWWHCVLGSLTNNQKYQNKINKDFSCKICKYCIAFTCFPFSMDVHGELLLLSHLSLGSSVSVVRCGAGHGTVVRVCTAMERHPQVLWSGFVFCHWRHHEGNGEEGVQSHQVRHQIGRSQWRRHHQRWLPEPACPWAGIIPLQFNMRWASLLYVCVLQLFSTSPPYLDPSGGTMG